MGMVTSSFVMGIADGPTEVHKVTVAKQILRDYPASNELFPAYHIPRLREAARERYADDLKAIKEGWERRQAAEPAGVG
jgi:acyl-CoA dehydrogenase